MSEKPLHVRVAEALGWTATERLFGDEWSGKPYSGAIARRICTGADMLRASPYQDTGSYCETGIPRYDTDWSATGPLIEKYGIWLQKYKEAGFFDWRAEAGDVYMRKDGSPITGETPLEAVCHLILGLAEAGKI